LTYPRKRYQILSHKKGGNWLKRGTHWNTPQQDQEWQGLRSLYKRGGLRALRARPRRRQPAAVQVPRREGRKKAGEGGGESEENHREEGESKGREASEKGRQLGGRVTVGLNE
jgi:hypothetical protein